MASARARFDANFLELIPSYVLYLMLQPIRESSFRDTYMSRGHAMVDVVNLMGSEWQDVTWLAPPVAILTGDNLRRFAQDNCVDEGDVCVLEMERGHPYISRSLSSPRKLQIKLHVFRMGFP